MSAGGPSGAGVATTVTLGAVAYPMLAKAGYDIIDAVKDPQEVSPALLMAS